MTLFQRGLARPPGLLVLGMVAFIAGWLLGAWWHAGHDEFETGADQLQAQHPTRPDPASQRIATARQVSAHRQRA